MLISVSMLALALSVAGFGRPAPTAALGQDPCVVNAANCARITMTLTGNGEGSIVSSDGFINCVRTGGETQGICTHRYDLTAGPAPYGITFMPFPGSVICFNGGGCSTNGGAQGALLQPGDELTFTADFQLIETPQPTVGPTKTPKPTPRPTKTPAPTVAPTATPAPTAPAATDGAVVTPGLPSLAPSLAPAPTVEPTPIATLIPVSTTAGEGTGPSAMVLLFGALLVGVVAFAGGYATALRRRPA